MKASGIIGWWMLDNEHVSGTLARDRSRNSNDGTITAGAGGLANGIYSQSNGAYDFDATDTIIDTGTDIVGILPLTISVWIYPDGWGEGNRGRIITNDKLDLVLRNTTADLLFYSDGLTLATSAASSISLSTWQHICVTRNAAGTANFYIDGASNGTANQASGAPVAGAINITIGNRTVQSSTFDGRLFDLRLYSYVMAAWQIKRLYDSYGV